MKRKILLLAGLFVLGFSLSALDFSLRPGGFVFFPGGPGSEAADGNERFDIGGGGEAGVR